MAKKTKKTKKMPIRKRGVVKKSKKKIVRKKIASKVIKKKIIKKKPIKKKIEIKKVKTRKAKIRKTKVRKTRKKSSPKNSESRIFEGVHKTKIRIIGIGGGGGSIISEIVNRISKADFIAANTDVRALKGLSKKVRKFQFGQTLTNGLGTGMNVEIGEQAALQEKEKIKNLFENQDLCIIVSSLGGGTGAGATPVFAKIAKTTKCLTYGIFTLPFEFEGEKKMEIAKQALLKLKPYFNIFSIIPNERIFQIIDKNTPLQEALSAINERLVSNLEGLIEMIYSTGLINIDFADLKTVLGGYGKLAYLNTVQIAETAKEEAARKVILTPLYPYSTKGSRGILYNIVGGRALCLSDVSKISEIISESVNRNAKIIFGIDQNKKHKDKIKITLLAAGCISKNELLKKKKVIRKQKVKHSIKKEEEEIKIKPEVQEKPKPKLKTKPKTKISAHRPKKQKIVSEPKIIPKKEIRAKKEFPKNLIQNQAAEAETKVRRNALEVRKVAQEEEKEFLEKENIWETPAILRKKEDD